MIGAADITAVGRRLAERSGAAPPSAWDLRIETEGVCEVPAALRHAKHLALMRAYQARYVLLPTGALSGSIVDCLRRHYDPQEMAALEALRHGLEAELIAPAVAAARANARGRDWRAYAEALQTEVASQPENAFVAYVRTSSHREAHYRQFLLQSSADLLAEASASALGVVGEFGAPQSALFRILIDEFGYGVHGKKHSVLYRAVMRDFGLPDEYNACWPLFDTATLDLHNTVHHLFQNPANFFLQVGFLLFAETAYQRSTQDHFRYLREFHPQADARYFGEHAHIDLHHTAMVIEEVAAPLVANYGADVGVEIVAGAELTRRAFDDAGAHMLATARAFDNAAAGGQATPSAPDMAGLGRGVTATGAAALAETERLQVGGLGQVTAGVFAGFPADAYARRLVS
ncbi:iron-containing redox enzyme family protein [uncultured Phenylobacterium sp.]|uniref:iron-containing redox enzyme family protein n=1 Tax=uncultured Phenylobacterium sp. TaxID=349273 RepID=UPI0025F05D70|nr:iron-containing redox enzyme family protein [uncultured Phenylobacterium sp.]